MSQKIDGLKQGDVIERQSCLGYPLPEYVKGTYDNLNGERGVVTATGLRVPEREIVTTPLSRADGLRR